MEYEICYLIGESREVDLDSIRKGVEEIVTKEGGVLLDGEFLEKRKMAYEIKKEIRGTYIAKRFTVATKDDREEKEYPGKDVVGEITKKMNLNNDVLRFIVVKTDDLPELVKDESEAKEVKEEKKTEAPKKNVVVKKPKKERVKEEVKGEKKEEEKPASDKSSDEVKPAFDKSSDEVKEEEDIDKKLDEILNM